MRVGVTGCTSQIGESVCERLLTSGLELFRIGRKEEFTWNLGEKIPKLKLDSLIHLAHDRNMGETQFLAATKSILQSLDDKTFLVNLSSTSSHLKAISKYGRNKYLAENLILESGGAVFKSGLIFRDTGPSHQSGILGTVVDIVDKLPVIPLPYRGKNKFFFTEIATLSKLLVDSAVRNSPGVFRAFNPNAITFDELIKSIALHLQVKRRTILVPDSATNRIFQIVKLVGGRGRLDSLLSLSEEISQFELEALLSPKFDFPKFTVNQFHHHQS
jgi:nucleoside-diphosphate-sugar epimerase